ncbi:MAG: N-formylglutamate amidohydrolase [Mesorhizobium sp.]
MDISAAARWPDAVEILNATGKSEIILLCEHASNHIPEEYDCLGLEPRHLERHIAWDIGAEKLARQLARRLDAIAFLGRYSRLLIDLNRPLGTRGSIPLRSEDTDIPGNAGLSEKERDFRADRMFWPFHHAVRRHVSERLDMGIATCIVSVHSFTPVFLNQCRPWHAGVLYGEARTFGERAVALLQANRDLVVAPNVPYVISLEDDYAVPVYGDGLGIPAILLEIRQDLLAADAGIQSWADHLTTMLSAKPWHSEAAQT